MSLVCLVRASVAAVVLLFKILHAESREFRPRNCAVSVLKVRARRKIFAQTNLKDFEGRATHVCAFGQGFAGAGSVSRAKNAPKLIETLAI